MNKKALIKYTHGTDKGLMHYVVFEGDVVERGVVPHLQQCVHVALFRQLDGHLVSILIRRVVYLLDDGVSQQCFCKVVGVGQFGCDGLSRILGEAGVGE